MHVVKFMLEVVFVGLVIELFALVIFNSDLGACFSQIDLFKD